MFKNIFKKFVYKLRGRVVTVYNKKFNPERIVFADEKSAIIEPRRLLGGKYIIIGSNVKIEPFGWIAALESFGNQKYSPKISIGNNIFIGHYCCITAIDEVVIEDGCLLSEYVYISDHGHGLDPRSGSPGIQPLVSKGKTIIGKNSFIGYGACILPGVVLGQHCVVGANSVVTSSFPDYSMIAGSPAKLIKYYSFEESKWISKI